MHQMSIAIVWPKSIPWRFLCDDADKIEMDFVPPYTHKQVKRQESSEQIAGKIPAYL